MTDVYVVRNQLGHYWGKAKEWVDGTEPNRVMRASHEDEAINTLVELSSKDYELRGEVLCVALTERGVPVVTPSEHLLAVEPSAGHSKEPSAGDNKEPSAEQQQAPSSSDQQAAAS